jgi:BlaI family penicillinase repressor
MKAPRLSKLELQIMQAFWTLGPCSIREVQETFPLATRPAYSTVQTMVYRLEAKKAVRRAKKISNAYIFEAVISSEDTQRKLLGELISLFGGVPVMTQLLESGKVTLKDLDEARKALRRMSRKEKS